MVKVIYGLVIVAVLAGTGWFLYHSFRSVRTETFVSSAARSAVPTQQGQSTCATDKDCPDGGQCVVSKGSCGGDDTSSTCAVKTCAKPVACPQDARQCSDGSSVSRTGADCEFAACPTIGGKTVAPLAPTSNMLGQTPYTNAVHKYSILTPKGWTTDGKSNYFIDATYIDPKADTEGKLTFKTNINVGAVAMNVAGISSLDDCVTAEKLAKLFPKYVSTGDARDTVSGTSVRIIGGTYDYGDYHLRNMQLLAVKNGFYYDVTATALASQWEKHQDEIVESLRSLVVQ